MHVPVSTYTIGVDIGGTFTDVVVLAADGAVTTAKCATTPDDFSGGVIDALGDAARGMQMPVNELLGRTSLIKHGSTVATNALITRGGARVGLITTRGFEDTPFIMRAVGRVDGLSEDELRHVAEITKPEPLVPPELVRGVRERIDGTGRVVVPLNEEDAHGAVHELIEQEGVEALAVSFLHAWLNPTHEHAVRELVQRAYGTGGVYLSVGSGLSQVAGEYARTNTALANAFVGPIVERYLANLEAKLRAAGFAGRMLVMQGNGGLTAREQATPISTLQSGPAGGVLASALAGQRLHQPRVITTDMGGTSFDVGLVSDGYWRYAEEPVFERLRILQPIIDIESIGAGGGTIARFDPATARLLVGPQSAGANPGPVCYGAGGVEPTVTDCDLMLGYLTPDYFLGGRRRLDLEAARAAINERLARPLRMDVADAAAGVCQIVDSKMSDLIRREVVRGGHLPEEYVLYAFGGAGPVHAVSYARELGIRRILVSPTSSVFSAFGIAMADLLHTRLATVYHPLPVAPEALNQTLADLEEGLARELADEGVATPTFRRYLTMRFRRQTTGEEVLIPWDRFTSERVDRLADLFVRRYEELYGAGVAYTDTGIDVAGVRVDAVGHVVKPEPAEEPLAEGSLDRAGKRTRPVWFGGGYVETPVYEYGRLGRGMRVCGPAIVESPFTTVVLPPDSGAELNAYLDLVIAP
ncbi:MAG: hydantoinase/oxoprolinase family protein [Nocardioidaceae bacterium]